MDVLLNIVSISRTCNVPMPVGKNHYIQAFHATIRAGTCSFKFQLDELKHCFVVYSSSIHCHLFDMYPLLLSCCFLCLLELRVKVSLHFVLLLLRAPCLRHLDTPLHRFLQDECVAHGSLELLSRLDVNIQCLCGRLFSDLFSMFPKLLMRL